MNFQNESVQSRRHHFIRQVDFEKMLNDVSILNRVGILLIVCAQLMQARTTAAQETQLSEGFAMVMLPPAATVEIDENEAQAVNDFFHHAEYAIQSENIDSLMALYSDKYTNSKSGDKNFATEIWNKIFARFDNVSSRHSMRLIEYDKASDTAITECSGLLFGTPAGGTGLVVIDRWNNEHHIMTKEGQWKLLGTTGETALRYGEKDALLHPLF